MTASNLLVWRRGELMGAFSRRRIDIGGSISRNRRVRLSCMRVTPWRAKAVMCAAIISALRLVLCGWLLKMAPCSVVVHQSAGRWAK